MEGIIRFYHDGVEMTTRHELAIKYPGLAHTTMQRLLQRDGLVRVDYKHQHYYEKASVEQFIETHAPARALAPPATLTDEELIEQAYAKLSILDQETHIEDEKFWVE